MRIRKVYGISISISSFERGLWFDSDERAYQPDKWGIRMHLAFGKMIRPVPCLHQMAYWKWLFAGKPDDSFNPWKGGNYWFIIRIPWFIYPFVAVALGKVGFYIGFKTFEVWHPKHTSNDRYGRWLKENEAGTESDPAEYLQFTVSFRRTRWK